MNDTKDMLALDIKPNSPNDPYIAGTNVRIHDIANYILEGKSNTEIVLLQMSITDEQIDLVREAMDKGGATRAKVNSMVPRIGVNLAVNLAVHEDEI